MLGEMPKHLKVTPLDNPDKAPKDKDHKDDKALGGDIGPMDVHPDNHTHFIDNSGWTYVGSVWGEVVKEATNCSYTNTLTSGYSHTRQFGNRFSLSGTWEFSQIRYTVGYDFTYTTSEQWSDSMTLQPRTAGKLQIRDWYNTNDGLQYHTQYYDYFWNPTVTIYGSGWTAQWISKEIVLLDKPLVCP